MPEQRLNLVNMAVFLKVQVAVLAIMLAPRTSSGQAPENCTAADVGIHYCQDCKMGVRCATAGTPPEGYVMCTHAGEVCTVIDATSTCVPIANSPCSCDKPQQCDAYDDGALLVCLDGGATIISQCPDTQPTCIEDICTVATEPGNPCENTTADEFVLLKPECTSAAYCIGGIPAGTVDCSAGQYFDPDVTACVTSPPVPCADACNGACPDKTDCSRYYVCDGSGHEDDVQDCEDPVKPYFDPVSKACQADESLCTPTHGCVFNVTVVPNRVRRRPANTTASATTVD